MLSVRANPVNLPSVALADDENALRICDGLLDKNGTSTAGTCLFAANTRADETRSISGRNAALPVKEPRTIIQVLIYCLLRVFLLQQRTTDKGAYKNVRRAPAQEYQVVVVSN